MATEIAEALLEMHFYRPLRDLLEQHFGRKVLRILKPTQNEEAFLGFDLAWVQPAESRIGPKSIQIDLKNFLAASSTCVPSLFLGYFLQFKVVSKVRGKAKAMPTGLRSPFLRSELSLKPNTRTRVSQHETLLKLSKLDKTDVSYACPMVLNQDDLHADPSLDDLRIVPVTNAPSGYASNDRHFIAFQTKTSEALWCSDPVLAGARTPRQWVEHLPTMDAREVDGWVRRVRSVVESNDSFRGGGGLYPYSMTLVALGEVTREATTAHA